MGAVSFLFSFLAVSIAGGEIVTRSFEPTLSDRLGASGFLYFLGLFVLIVSTLCYVKSSQKLRPQPRWRAGLLGGALAAATFCASVFGGYIVLGGFSLIAMLVLPIVASLLGPFLGRRRQRPNPSQT